MLAVQFEVRQTQTSISISVITFALVDVMRHEVDLLENAIDSLNEALRKFGQGQSGEHRAYKFAILHFSHFFELLFKYYVSRSHPLLVYKNPFSKKLESEQTIGLWEAIQFLKNEGTSISPELHKDLEWIKKLRNDIEHFKFTMDVAEVRRTLGRLIRATNEFNAALKVIDLEGHISHDCRELYDALADEFLSDLANARAEACEESEDEEGHLCVHCGQPDTGARIGHDIVCKLCGETEQMVRCCQCESELPQLWARVWNDDHPPHVDYICEDCEDYIMSR